MVWVKGEPVNGRGTDIPGEIQRRVIMNATYGTRRFACANTSNAFGCIPINLSGMQTRHGMKLLVIGDHRSNRTEGERERERRTTPIALFAGGVVADGYEERTFWKFCDTCACTFRSVIKQLRRYEGRDNSALELTDRLNIGLILLLSSIEFFHLLLNTFFINLLPSVCFEKFRYNF